MTQRGVRTITEPARELPVLLETDVVVAGGGTTGPVAAIAAARLGVRTVLIERFGSLGGIVTLGLNSKPSGPLTGGLPREIWNIARQHGAAGEDYTATLKNGSVKLTSPSDPEMMKILLARMCADAGVEILFECVAAAPIMDGQTVKGVIIEGKGGRQAILSKVVIDCSADADLAAQAGAPFVVGDGNDVMQPVTMYFKMGNVDLERLAEWARAHPEHVTDRFISETDTAYGLWLTGFTTLLKAFQARTGIKLQRENITLKTANGEMYVNATRVIGASGLSPIDISRSIMECYRQIEAYARFLKEDVPGFEHAYVSGIAPILGVRETRHIVGEYTLTEKDIVSRKRFDDSIAVDAAMLDVHDPKGSDVRIGDQLSYEIPYRCLVPQKVEQLLVAGRSISADHAAHARTRNIPACMATGQAAGIAAGIAIKEETPVRRVPVPKVQQVLRGLGMPIKIEEYTEVA